MAQDIARDLRDRCLDAAGDQLRLVVVYTPESLEATYRRDDIAEAFESLSLDALINPVWKIHRALRLAGRLHEAFGGHEGSIHTYENVVVFQFPLDRERGILVSFDAGNRSPPFDLYAECSARVSGSSDDSE